MDMISPENILNPPLSIRTKVRTNLRTRLDATLFSIKHVYRKIMSTVQLKGEFIDLICVFCFPSMFMKI